MNESQQPTLDDQGRIIPHASHVWREDKPQTNCVRCGAYRHLGSGLFPCRPPSGNLVTEQPPPTPNALPAVWDLVIADMRARDAEGRRKYGVPLQPGNGRDSLVDAFQEALDLVVYLRQAIYERDGR